MAATTNELPKAGVRRSVGGERSEPQAEEAAKAADEAKADETPKALRRLGREETATAVDERQAVRRDSG